MLLPMIRYLSILRKVYDSALVMNFIADATGKERMYHMEDEFQAINIMYMHDGCSRAWHYDGNDTVITLLLQKAAVGKRKVMKGLKMWQDYLKEHMMGILSKMQMLAHLTSSME